MEGGFVRGSHDKEVATIDLKLGFYAGEHNTGVIGKKYLRRWRKFCSIWQLIVVTRR